MDFKNPTNTKILQFFDQPSALRQFYGLIQYVNDYNSGSKFYSFQNENLYVMFNCRNSEIQKVLSKPIAKNMYELALG